MNRKEIGMIVQGAGVIAVVVSAVFVSKFQPMLALLAVGGVVSAIVGHFIKGKSL